MNIPNRRSVVIALVVFTAMMPLVVAAYLLWSPGLDVREGAHYWRTNGLWMQHGWLGDDAWFKTAREGCCPVS